MRDSQELLRLINGAMVAAGVDADAVYQKLACEPSLFTDTPRRCPHEYQALFWKAVEQVSGDDEISLQFCPHLPIFRGEALEFLLLSAPTLRDGMQAAMRFSRLISDAIQLQLIEDHQGARLRLTGAAFDSPQRRHTDICLVYGIINTLRVVSGRVFQPRSVCLAMAARRPLPVYADAFGCPVYFDATDDGRLNEIELDPAMLGARSAHGNEAMLAIHVACAEAQLAGIRNQDVIDQVKGLLEEHHRNRPIGLDRELEDIALEMGMPLRTVRSELSQAGTSFRKLKSHARMAVAQRLLCDTDQAISHIAELTGFSEATAFHRAFRNWNGHTPQIFREKSSNLSLAG